ncbi:MAG: type VI secretion system protein TssA [Candidatus Competibacteraceae bacterium]|nr:MAG: type VI secretion system protein TssA [Candidatus Competibacteraceae bacterium]
MSIIDVESLLSEIAADAPCGEDLEYDPQFAEMEKQARGTSERQYGDTIIPGEPPDWRGVAKTALGLLERTRDLRVAAYLTRASLNTDGLRGFTDGLALLEGLIERHWESVYPQLDPDDDNDPTLRVNTIVSLCDPETTLRDLRVAPLVHSRSLGRFSLRDVQVAAGLLTPVVADEEHTPPNQTMIDGAFQEASLEDLQAIAETVAEAMERAERIEALLTDRVGVTAAPDMSALAGVLKEIRQILTEQLRRRGVEGASEDETGEFGESGAAGGTLATGQRTIVGDIAGREDVIRMLDKICDYYRRYEPSSPVPFMLRRAQKLVTMDFMEVLRDLAPNATEQTDLIFGVRPEETE